MKGIPASMSYRIPKDYEIARAIENCLSRTPKVRSLNVLTELVQTELMGVNGTFRVGGERIRRVGIRYGLFNLEIRYAHTDGPPSYERCPVCKGPLVSVKNMTLDWETVEISRECRRCGYSAKSDASRPARYIITRRTDSGRAEKLRVAEGLLNEAADLMDQALWMSGMEPRSGKDSETIRRIASDKDYAGSLHNMAADIEYQSKEQPSWTQPLTSPKNQFDISPDGTDRDCSE